MTILINVLGWLSFSVLVAVVCCLVAGGLGWAWRQVRPEIHSWTNRRTGRGSQPAARSTKKEVRRFMTEQRRR